MPIGVWNIFFREIGRKLVFYIRYSNLLLYKYYDVNHLIHHRYYQRVDGL